MYILVCISVFFCLILFYRNCHNLCTGAVKLRFPYSSLTDAEAKIKRSFQTANGRRVESHDSDFQN